MRDFYDPNGTYASLPSDQFYDELLATREGVAVNGLGVLVGHEIAFAESRHALLDPHAAVLDGVSPARQLEIAEYYDHHAASLAKHVGKLAVDRSRPLSLLSEYDIAPTNEPDLMLMAAHVMAAIAHHGVMRRSGRPYITHPEEVAGIVAVAWRKSHAGETNDELRQYVASAYLHDTYEDTVDPQGKFLAKPAIASPLTIRQLLANYSFAHTDRVVNGVRLLNHGRGIDGTKLPYQQYMFRGVRYGGQSFAIPKGADNQHNSHIDPDRTVSNEIAKLLREQQRAHKYRAGKEDLLRISEDFDSLADTKLLHAIFSVEADELRQHMYRQKIVRLSDDEARRISPIVHAS